MDQKVIVGMSGGVDSSVAALILKRMGYDVTGVTMRMFPEGELNRESGGGMCNGESAAEDAARVARIIGIRHIVADFTKEFETKVIDYFVNEYLEGRTPNPCIVCNSSIKWKALLEYGLSIGAGLIATGHYGRIIKLDNGRYSVAQSDNSHKDQSYVLYGLTQEELSRTIFPLSMMSKDEVRRIAREAGLPVAGKKDSQDICFIKDGDYAGYITERTGIVPQPGNFVDINGRVLGKHRGIIHYTIGQRKGLGIAFGEPRYVIRINAAANEVVLGRYEELMSKEVYVRNVNYMALPAIDKPVRAAGRIRYNASEVMCTLYSGSNNMIRAVFDEPVKSAALGQAAVFYADGYILCGGIIA